MILKEYITGAMPLILDIDLHFNNLERVSVRGSPDILCIPTNTAREKIIEADVKALYLILKGYFDGTENEIALCYITMWKELKEYVRVVEQISDYDAHTQADFFQVAEKMKLLEDEYEQPL